MYTDPSDEDAQVVVEEIVETTESQIHVVKFFDHSDQNTLTCAAAAQDRDGLAAVHGQAYAIQHPLSSEGFVNVLDLDSWRESGIVGFGLYSDLIDCGHNLL